MIERGIPKAVFQSICDDLQALWRNAAFRPAFSFPRSVHVVTKASNATDALIRGMPGVTVSLNDQEGLQDDVVFQESFLPGVGLGSELPEEVQFALKEHINELFEAAANIPGLNARLFEGVGYKHFEPYELDLRVGSMPEKELRQFAIFPVVQIFLDTFRRHGLSAENWRQFQSWSSVVDELTKSFRDLAERQNHRYTAVAFLNGPILSGDSVEIGTMSDGTIVSLVRVSDAMLTHAANSRNDRSLPQNVLSANTAIRYDFTIPVEESVDTYLNKYITAAAACERALDLIRILVEGDFGVSYMWLNAVDLAAPGIRPTYTPKYHPDLDPFFPRRSWFPPTSDPIDDSALSEMRELFPRAIADVKIPGWNVALDRFRISYDRYDPQQPERLLDIAIAFEALFLNEGDGKELGHRLRVRVARMLHASLADRVGAFDILKQLYDVRSAIAHGETIANASAEKGAKIATVLREAPRLLRAALKLWLQGKGPEDVSKKDLPAWWRDIELGP